MSKYFQFLGKVTSNISTLNTYIGGGYTGAAILTVLSAPAVATTLVKEVTSDAIGIAKDVAIIANETYVRCDQHFVKGFNHEDPQTGKPTDPATAKITGFEDIQICDEYMDSKDVTIFNIPEKSCRSTEYAFETAVN